MHKRDCVASALGAFGLRIAALASLRRLTTGPVGRMPFGSPPSRWAGRYRSRHVEGGGARRRRRDVAIRESGPRRKTAHRLDQRAETRQRRVRAGLAEARHPDDDQIGIGLQQCVRAKPHFLKRAKRPR